jgi:anti-sigma factor RsiW
MTCPITDEDLHAYVDGRLDEPRRAALEAWLTAHPSEAERVHQYQRINQELHSLFDPVLREPIPAGLVPAPKPRRRQLPLQAAAAVLVFLLGGAAGWLARDATAPASGLSAALPQLAASAHIVYLPEVRHPVEVGAEEEQHLVAWLSKRLGTQIHAPSLGELGYSLIGGRLLPAAKGQPAAFFMYQDEQGNRLTLYVRAGLEDRQGSAFRYAEENGIGVFYWVEGELGYALTGEAERARLLRAAHLVYRSLNT